MNKTVFWLARDMDSEKGFVSYFKSEPVHTAIGWKYKNGYYGDNVPDYILPATNIRKGQKIKIIRTVTDDGQVVFEKANHADKIQADKRRRGGGV